MSTGMTLEVTAEDIDIVKSTWSQVIVYRDKVGSLFYSKLFELAPQVKPLFKSDPLEQSRKLTGMITVVVTKLDKLDEILPEVRALAIRHNKYGTQPSHFDIVGKALIWTLSQAFEDKWTLQMQSAWTKIYTLLANAMIQAMQEGK